MKQWVCPGPFAGWRRSRRSFLQIGASGMAGLGLSDLFSIQSRAGSPSPTRKGKSVIFVWLPGGPAHLDTYDMKPDAPSEFRGDFKPIRTKVPGTWICELFPRQARLTDKFNIVRSVCHDFADHGGAHKRFMTGRIPATPTEFVNDAPAVTSIVCQALEGSRRGPLPACVAGVDEGRNHIDVFSLGPAYLGSSNTPFMVAGDPSQPHFKVQNLALAPEMAARLDDRAMLLRGIDRLRRDVDRGGLMSAMDRFSVKALEMLTSPGVREAFDLSTESPETRDRYGWNAYGQRGLLARRLVEAGCPFVTMVWENPFPSKPIPRAAPTIGIRTR